MAKTGNLTPKNGHCFQLEIATFRSSSYFGTVSNHVSNRAGVQMRNVPNMAAAACEMCTHGTLKGFLRQFPEIFSSLLNFGEEREKQPMHFGLISTLLLWWHSPFFFLNFSSGGIHPSMLFGQTRTISAAYIKHCQRHNGPRIMTPYLEKSQQQK